MSLAGFIALRTYQSGANRDSHINVRICQGNVYFDFFFCSAHTISRAALSTPKYQNRSPANAYGPSRTDPKPDPDEHLTQSRGKCNANRRPLWPCSRQVAVNAYGGRYA